MLVRAKVAVDPFVLRGTLHAVHSIWTYSLLCCCMGMFVWHRIAYFTDLFGIVLHIPQTCLASHCIFHKLVLHSYCIFHRLVLHRTAYSIDLSCIVLHIPQTCLASYCIFHRLVLHRIAYSIDLSCIVLNIP